MPGRQKNKSNGNEQRQIDDVEDYDDGELVPPTPPDGGWGWLVVAASFLTNLVVDGVCYTFGIIMPELVDYFETTNSKAALAGSMVPAIYLIVGPIVSALANRFGCRIVAVIGSALAGVFFAVSQWSSSIDIMIITYGVMGGIGFGMMYLPSIVMVGFYFDKKRAMATGIAVCGSGIGTFIFAPLASWLVETYTWRGANIIIGAIIFHGIACALLYLPLEPTRRKPQETGANGSNPESAIFRNIIAEKKRNRTISTGSLDGTVITKDNQLVPGNIPSSGTATSLMKIEEAAERADEETKGSEEIAVLPGVTQQMSESTTGGTGTSITVVESTASLPQNKQIDRVKYGGGNTSTPSRTRTTSTCSQRSMSGSQSKLEKQATSPFARQDIFYTGSVTSLHEYKASADMKAYVQSYTDLPTADATDGVSEGGCCDSAKNIVMKMFDFSLLMSPSFMVICLSGILTFAGLYTPFVYAYKKALDLGTSKSTASIIISLIGIFNTAGRLAAGWLADRPWADSLVIHNVAAIIAGFSTCFVAFFNTFGLLVAYACWFGTFIAAFIALRSIVIVDLIGIKKLTNAFGLTSLFQGIACLIGSPMSGAILESTGSYVGPFLVSGLLVAAGGLVCLPARKIAAWEHARSEKRQYQPVKKNETA